ncbi:MAG: hypothetical protein AAFR52_16120, partial [Pseudomonadota bacterium]
PAATGPAATGPAATGPAATGPAATRPAAPAETAPRPDAAQPAAAAAIAAAASDAVLREDPAVDLDTDDIEEPVTLTLDGEMRVADSPADPADAPAAGGDDGNDSESMAGGARDGWTGEKP